MTITTEAALPNTGADPAGLLHTVLALSLTAVALLRPVYAADGEAIVDFTWVLLNPAGQRMLGQPARPEASLLTLFPTAQTDGVFGVCCHAYRTGIPQRNETNYQADGLDGYFLLVAQRHDDVLVVNFTDTNDQPRSAVEVALRQSQAREQEARAATERQRAALQLSNEDLEERVRARTAQVREQQRLLRHILESVPAAIATLSGPEHRFSFANARYQYLVGDRATEGQAVAEALPEVVEQGVVALLDRVYQTGEPFIGRNVMLMLEQPPGPAHQFYYDLTYLPLRDGQDQVQGILVFAVEVTEQVRVRRQATLLQAELLAGAQRQAQERQDLYQVFEQTPTTIVLLREPSHTIDYHNPAFAATFPPEGLAADALRGRRLMEVYPRMREAGLVKLLDRVYETGEPQVVLEMPLAELHPGSPRFVTFAYQAYREWGRIVGVAAFVYDTTEQVRARQQVQQLNQELHASNAQLTRINADLDTFIYTASHDLKAPITNIEGLLGALREELVRTPPDATGIDYLLQLMDDSIARFQSTIGNLSSVVQLQKTGSRWQEQTELARVIDEVCLDLAGSLEAAQAQVAVEVAACPTLRLAPKDLRSIIYNLLSNALKYRSPGRPARVQVQATCDDQGAELRVQDNGIGLSQAQQANLFQLFQRLHQHVEGSGVGLYSIKRLIENVGGSIRVESEEGVGSTFIVRLPA